MTESPFRCRICRSSDHSLILDYGPVALADSFLSSLEHVAEEPKFQLTLVFCDACHHVQIREILPPEMLFSNYAWETGIPASIHAYCRAFADEVLRRAQPAPGARVVEIASNDGTMLQEFKRRGFEVTGIDPARNIAEKARQRGIPTLADFFDRALAERILAREGQADLIVARNVLAHVADLHGLVQGVRLLLAPSGTAVVEVPHLLRTHDELQYDQVFHEHIGYHSLESIERLFEPYGLRVVDVESVWIHGGSLRAYLRHAASAPKASEAVNRMAAQEARAGILALSGWQEFGARVHEQKRLLRLELEAVAERRQVAVGYGASAKGQSLIQFCELDERLIRYVVDKSHMKIGKWTPGSHIPIHSPDTMRSDTPAVIVLFAWNFAEEILNQEDALRRAGARFLHPIPAPRYLD